jgi:hypothetical protein
MIGKRIDNPPNALIRALMMRNGDPSVSSCRHHPSFKL